MKRLSAVAGAGITVVAMSLALVGCGSDTKTEEKTSAEKTTTSETTTSKETTTSAAPTPEAAGPNKTIQDYIKENNIQETVIKRGDPGPTIDLPVPDGWKATDSLPEAPYGAIVYEKTEAPDNPPRILAIFSKLTGNVDPREILALAPGELRNLPGYDGPTVIGGTYEQDGKKGMIAQKTVVIPADDGVYVLQLNAYSTEAEANILMDGTSVIDEQTKIAP
jgi:hypothetical protein